MGRFPAGEVVLTGDVTTAGDVATLVGTANVEAIVRANRLDQLTAPTSALNLNSQRLIAVANGATATDAPNMSQLGGWAPEAGTWTYASASTFTIPGNLTAVYTKGTKLKWVDSSTTKYGVVVSSSYSSPNTTVTIAVTSDYVVGNATITSPQYAYGMPPDFPTHFTWSGYGFTGFSVNPSNIIGNWWSINGGLCTVNLIPFTAGTSNSTAYTITGLPIAPTNYAQPPTPVENAGSIVLGTVLASPASTALIFNPTGGTFTASGSKNGAALLSFPI